MDNIKNDKYYVVRIRDDLKFITHHMEGVSIEELTENEILQDSMMFRLIQISENAKKLSDKYKEEHAIIPWFAIYGLRNKIVHDYGNVDMSIVHETLIKDIPTLLQMLEQAVNE